MHGDIHDYAGQVQRRSRDQRNSSSIEEDRSRKWGVKSPFEVEGSPSDVAAPAIIVRRGGAQEKRCISLKRVDEPTQIAKRTIGKECMGGVISTDCNEERAR